MTKHNAAPPTALQPELEELATLHLSLSNEQLDRRVKFLRGDLPSSLRRLPLFPALVTYQTISANMREMKNTSKKHKQELTLLTSNVFMCTIAYTLLMWG